MKMKNKWDKASAEAKKKTDKKLEEKEKKLLGISDEEIEKIVMEEGLSKKDIHQALEIVQDASESNEKVAQNLAATNKGIQVLVSIVRKRF